MKDVTSSTHDFRVREAERAEALKKKTIRSVEGKRAANGGFIITHRFNNDGPGPYKESEDLPFGEEDGHKVLAHFAKHLGIKATIGAPAPAGTVEG